MSIEIMSKVFKDTSLKSTQTLVMLAIADNATGEEGREGTCFPSVSLIAKKTRLSRSTIARAINSLIQSGHLLKSCRQRENGSSSSNIYLCYPADNLALLNDDVAPFFKDSKIKINDSECSAVTPPPPHSDTPHPP